MGRKIPNKLLSSGSFKNELSPINLFKKISRGFHQSFA